MAKFIILALPRSRTKWLSEFLAFDGRNAVGHDLAVECSSVQDFEDSLDAVDGSVETGAVLGWRLLRARQPKLRIVTIHRPLWQIANSFSRLGVIGIDWQSMQQRADMLAALSLQPGVRNANFDELDNEDVIKALWEFCLQSDFDYEWWLELRQKNLQIDMAGRIARLAANARGLDALKLDMQAQLAEVSSCGLN